MDRQKILVVDDENRMRKLVKDFLQRENFEVLEAGDGSEALDIFFAAEGYCTDDSGCDDAEDGRLAGMPGDPELFQSADYHADGREAMRGMSCRDLSWAWMNIFPSPSARRFWWREWRRFCAAAGKSAQEDEVIGALEESIWTKRRIMVTDRRQKR